MCEDFRHDPLSRLEYILSSLGCGDDGFEAKEELSQAPDPPLQELPGWNKVSLAYSKGSDDWMERQNLDTIKNQPEPSCQKLGSGLSC